MDQSKVIFTSWFTGNGGYLHPSVEIDQSSLGKCLRVKKDGDAIEHASKIVSCPKALMVSFNNALSSTKLRPLIERASSISNEIISLRFFLLEQYQLGRESFWWPYIHSLPQPGDLDTLNTPVLFNEEDFRWLEGTNLGAATQTRRVVWRQEFEDAMSVLRSGSAASSWDTWTWDLYLWATTIMTSRSFPAASVSHPHMSIPALVPALDLLNHSRSAQVLWELGGDKYTISMNEKIEPGGEVFNNYGPKSNEELLIGYGFCSADNPSDAFGLGFNSSVSKKIQGVKEARGTSILQMASADENKAEDENDASVSEQHSVWITQQMALNSDDSYEFSLYFLEHSSIAVENTREQSGHRKDWANSQSRLTTDSMCRNKLHVLATTTMLLEKSLLEIKQHSEALSKPSNHRQRIAATYREEQLKILNHVLAKLHRALQVLLEGSPTNRVLRIEQALNTGPKAFLKDFRSLAHLALGTRNETKIKNREGEECVFTFWLCGLWILRNNGTLNDNFQLSRECMSWLKLLDQWYGIPSTNSDQSLTLNSANGYHAAIDSETLAIGASYLEVIRQAVQKHPSSVYHSQSVSLSLIAWCMNVVRSEGVRYPDPFVSMDQEVDEFVLFLETSA